jgi:hypothetical protein
MFCSHAADVTNAGAPGHDPRDMRGPDRPSVKQLVILRRRAYQKRRARHRGIMIADASHSRVRGAVRGSLFRYS